MRESKKILIFIIVVLVIGLLAILIANLTNLTFTQKLKNAYKQELNNYGIEGGIGVKKNKKNDQYVDVKIDIAKLDSMAESDKYNLLLDLDDVHKYANLIVYSALNQYTVEEYEDKVEILCNGKVVKEYLTMNAFVKYVEENNITLKSKDIIDNPKENVKKLFTLEGKAVLDNEMAALQNEDNFVLKVTEENNNDGWYVVCEMKSFKDIYDVLKKEESIIIKAGCIMTVDNYKYLPYTVATLDYACWQ